MPPDRQPPLPPTPERSESAEDKAALPETDGAKPTQQEMAGTAEDATEATDDLAATPSEQAGSILGGILDALRQRRISAEQILEAVVSSEHTDETLRQAIKKDQLSTLATDGVLGPNPFVGIRLQDVGSAVGMIAKQSLRQPRIALRHLVQFAREELQALKGDSDLQPQQGDQRFTDPTWNENPLYRRFMQS